MSVSIPPYMSNVKSLEKINNANYTRVDVIGQVGDIKTKAHYAVPNEKVDEFVEDHKKTIKKIHKGFALIVGLGTILSGVAGFAAARKSGLFVKTIATILGAVVGTVGSTALGLLNGRKMHDKLLKKYDAEAMFFVKDNETNASQSSKNI